MPLFLKEAQKGKSSSKNKKYCARISKKAAKRQNGKKLQSKSRIIAAKYKTPEEICSKIQSNEETYRDLQKITIH